ncbi:MAG: GNAT family N-acetyltransferase [Tannerella sp.]|jgi:hypothetical protein|nr:GNAT family N-acetyltransferase [Tannerella sp.]
MSKELYKTLCNTDDSIPVFIRDWWLDAVCGKDWDVLLLEKNGKILAAMPLYIPCKGVISMPDYTQTMGIWFAKEAADMKYSSVLEHRQSLCRQLIEKLGNYHYYLQNFDVEFTDWLPFYWAGFSQTTRYTYKLNNISDLNTLLLNMSQQTRRNIRNAEEESIEVKRGISIKDFLKVQALTFERQDKKNIQSSRTLTKVIKTARKSGQGELFGGYDREGNLHAVAFVVWQKSSAYYIAGGGDPEFRSSGAHSLVLWEAIKYVSQYTDVFDFEGSMIQGVERFFREFGAIQTPYFKITKGYLGFRDRVLIKIKRKMKL